MATEKEERFKKIAAARTNRVINDLRLLTNCANKNNYSYTQEEVNQMLRAIEEAIRDLKGAFSKKTSQETKFQFGSKK